MARVSDEFDAVIVGGGILGLATAFRLLAARPGLRLCLLEKEAELAVHQTGHNSGVIHSGVYYTPGSLKARLCRAGRQSLMEYADEREIRWHRRGKLIVALDESELPRLAELDRRARGNGIEGLRILDGRELRDIEPHARGARALHVPETGVIDFGEVARALAADIKNLGGEIRTRARVTSLTVEKRRAFAATADGAIAARIIVVCSGLQADRMAGGTTAAGAAIVPFRGSYCTLKPRAAALVRGLIYPVPDPAFPFLGVHFTRHVDDSVAAGPNAVLALAREGYRRTSFSPRDAAATFAYPGFWRLVARHAGTGLSEMWRDWSRRAFVRDMQRYLPELCAEDVEAGGLGIRAQAVTPDGALADDFLITQKERVIHVVNAPSPGATSSLAIGEHIAALAAEALGGC